MQTPYTNDEREARDYCMEQNERNAEINAGLDLDAVIEAQQKAGYETYTAYLKRTCQLPTDEAWGSWLDEGRWLITSRGD